jgi:uncharacterized protein YggU (UPF0235/DUF167 family)
VPSRAHQGEAPRQSLIDPLNKSSAEKFRSDGDMTDAPWFIEPRGITISCRLTPKGGRDAIDGVAVLANGDRVLLARVRAAPEEGRANRALCELLALRLDVPISRVTILAGAKARIKRIAVAGDPQALVDRLRAL